MAQPIQCDPHGMAHLADWLVTRLADGEVQAYCNDAFLEFVTMAADAAAENEAEGADMDAMRLLAQTPPHTPEQEAELDAAAVAARLEGGTAIEATDDAIQEHPLEDIAVEGIGTVPSIDTAHVVKRGQSARAKAARRRQATIAAGRSPTLGESVGPDDDEDEDEDAAAGSETASP